MKMETLKKQAPVVDPVTQQVLAGAFVAICDEMGDVTIQTGNSSVLVEGRDFSCALLDRHSRLVAAANFDPSHLSAMAFTTEYAYMEIGLDRIEPGDVIVVNDPYRAGGHLPDMCVIRPIFFGGQIIGSSIVRAHHIDVGGMAVGGFAGTASSVFQEGIRIPPVRWYRAGVEQPDVMDIILLNVRFPEIQLGDFRAQLAATLRGEQRLHELANKYGIEALLEGMKLVQDHSESLMRAIFAEIPNGSYRFADFVEDDGLTNVPYKIDVELIVEDRHVTVDFTGTSAQSPGPINSSYTNTLSATMNAFLQIIGPEVTFNHGCFNPITVIAPRGSLVNPVTPAPVMGGVAETSLRIIDTITGALARAGAEGVASAGYGTTQNLTGGGFDSRKGREVGFYIFLEGGWGATAWRDGWNATPNASSNFQDYPAEILEQMLPVECIRVSLFEGSGGAGEYRGGLGTERIFRITSDGMELNALAERHVLQPWGLFGGQPGSSSSIEFMLPGDENFSDATTRFATVSPSKFANLRLPQDTIIRMRQGGGGGYGNPFRRDPELVRADVEHGYVTREGARETYRVEVNPDDTLNLELTEVLRSSTLVPAEPDYYGVATVHPSQHGFNSIARRPDDLPEPVRFYIEQGEALFSDLQSKFGSPSAPEILSDPERSPIAHPTARHYWDNLAVRRWMSRHGQTRRGSLDS